MTETWEPAKYKDQFRDDILALVKRKAKKGQVKEVAEPEAAEPAAGNVVDLMALLKESLDRKKPARAKRAA